MIEEMIARSRINLELNIPMVLPIKNLFLNLLIKGKEDIDPQVS